MLTRKGQEELREIIEEVVQELSSKLGSSFFSEVELLVLCSMGEDSLIDGVEILVTKTREIMREKRVRISDRELATFVIASMLAETKTLKACAKVTGVGIKELRDLVSEVDHSEI